MVASSKQLANFQLCAYTVPCREQKSIFFRRHSGAKVRMENGAEIRANRSARAYQPGALCCLLVLAVATTSRGQTPAPSPSRYLDPAHDPAALQLPDSTSL